MQPVKLWVVHSFVHPVNLLWIRAQAYLSDLLHQHVFTVADKGLEALALFVKGKE